METFHFDEVDLIETLHFIQIKCHWSGLVPKECFNFDESVFRKRKNVLLENFQSALASFYASLQPLLLAMAPLSGAFIQLHTINENVVYKTEQYLLP